MRRSLWFRGGASSILVSMGGAVAMLWAGPTSCGVSPTTRDDVASPARDDAGWSTPSEGGADPGGPLDGGDAGAGAPCTTRITYGAAWIPGPNHPERFDVAEGDVTWDGVCTFDGRGSVATLSNGWKPGFAGRGACVMALEHSAACASKAGEPRCTTRVAYGATWQRGPNHPLDYDDVVGRVYSDGACRVGGGNSYQLLSNGWVPGFVGSGTCEVSLRYQECGGLYENPVVDTDCPDPGVTRDGDRYIMTCTSGTAPAAFPILTSPDLVTWKREGFVFAEGKRPAWAVNDFWAPEIHKVGARYVAYYSALEGGGRFRLGAAHASTPTGPYTDLGRPLLSDGSVGLIDTSFFEHAGTRYLLWKTDGNATGQKARLFLQELAKDGLSVVGTPTFLIENDRAWEGPLVEAPFLIAHDGAFYLFYSANNYNDPNYAVGVARAPSPRGPFTKFDGPILRSGGGFEGPGHGSAVQTPSGDWWFVYHAWVSGKVGQAPGRLVLADVIAWKDGWPVFHVGPGRSSRAVP